MKCSTLYIKIYVIGTCLLLIGTHGRLMAQIHHDDFAWRTTNPQDRIEQVFSQTKPPIERRSNPAIALVSPEPNLTDHGIIYSFTGTLRTTQALTIVTSIFNPSTTTSIALSITLLDINDINNPVSLISTSLTLGAEKTKDRITLSYIPIASTQGHRVALKYSTTQTGTGQLFAIKYMALNPMMEYTPYYFILKPDLALTPCTSSQALEITAIENSAYKLLKGAPENLQDAETLYDKLGITVTSNGMITMTGRNIPNSFHDFSFLNAFAQDLNDQQQDRRKVGPKAQKALWLAGDLFCKGIIPFDINLYDARWFLRPMVLLHKWMTLPPYTSISIQNLMEYIAYNQYLYDTYFWKPTATSAPSSDVIYNTLSRLLGLVNYRSNMDEKLRFMKGFKRYLEKSLIYYPGITQIIKPDGTGFHHNVAYDNYMYAYETMADVLYLLRKTEFQIGKEYYKNFRDAVYAQTVFSNDYVDPTNANANASGMKPFSMGGRSNARLTTLTQNTLQKLAFVGGDVLNKNTTDPLLAGVYNRRFGINSAFGYNTKAPLPSGYFVFNYTQAGIFRKGNYLVACKGFNNQTFGAEIYAEENRYGRYQSYGAMEVIYPGSPKDGNGYTEAGWDWNYNPGTTTIVLPWGELKAGADRADEDQTSNFAGSLFLNKQNTELLSKTTGSCGLFAMNFQASQHNTSFKFKKSVFSFDDMIICLGSNINNNDKLHPTVTTLFQRAVITNHGTMSLDNNILSQTTSNGPITASISDPHWLIDNFKTGFYIPKGNGVISIEKKDQVTPFGKQTKNKPVEYGTKTYCKGYLNHKISPTNQSYEYVCIPNATSQAMTTLQNSFSTPNTTPYIVYQQDEKAHILNKIKENIWAYALFSNNTRLNNPGLVTANNFPCLVMFQSNAITTTNADAITISVVHPDFSISQTITLTLKGEWERTTNQAQTRIIKTKSSTSTLVEFSGSNGLPVETILYKKTTQPTITASGPTTFCQGESVTLTSSAGTTYLWSNKKTTQSIAITQTGIYSVTVTDSNGLSATSDLVTVTVNSVSASPTISASGATTFLQGGSVTLTSSPANSYLWNNGKQTQSITVSLAGVYSVTITDTCGNSATSTPITITLHPLPPLPTISASGPITLCQGGSLVLTANLANDYLWNNGEKTQSITVSSAGIYSVTITDTSGNSATSDPITITINPLPPPPTISANGAVLTSSSANNNQWYLDGNAIAGATSQDYTMTTLGNYTVVVTNISGCSASSISHTTTDDDFIIYPDPNNGEFQIRMPNGVLIQELKIYNIFGHLIYQSKTGETSLNLQGLSGGAYIIEIKTGNKTYKTKKFIIQ